MKKLIKLFALSCTIGVMLQPIVSNAQWTRNAATSQTYLTNTGDNVGIGTTTPAFKLDIQSTSTATMSFKSTGGNASILLDRNVSSSTASLTYRTAGVNNWQTGCVNNNNYTIRNNGLGQLTLFCDYITNNIGIGTNVPSNKLSVNGNADFSGNVGVGTTAPAYKLDVNGTGNFTGALKVGAYTLPIVDGTSGQVLKTNGAGALTWSGDNNTTYTPGTGISIVGTAINSVWTASGTNINNNNTGSVCIGSTANIFSGSTDAKILQVSATNYPQYILQSTNAPTDNKVWRMIARNNKVFQIQTLSDAFGTEQTALQIDRNVNSITDVLFPNGNVGIGTTAPGDKLSLKGGSISFHHPINDIPYVGIDYDTTTDGMRFRSNVLNYVLNTTQMFIRRTDGFVGIGTITPAYKLDVCGTIRSKEIKVATGWCDYVFEEEYNLRSINDMEKFIRENKHLPGILPAKDVESNGLNLGEMQKAMMEKIEELSLYIIQLSNENSQLKEVMVKAGLMK